MSRQYRMTDQESDKTEMVTHDFEKLWKHLEAIGDDRGRMSVTAYVDDPDDPDDGDIIGVMNGYVVHEDGEECFD